MTDFRSLKPGDEVAWINYRSGQGYQPAKVARVTCTGQIVLDDGGRFTAAGLEFGRSADTYGQKVLFVMNERIRAAIADQPRHELVEVLRPKLRGWEFWPLATLQAVAAAIDGTETENTP